VTAQTPSDALVKEALDLSRNCLYTSTSLFIWLRILRWIRVAFIVVPLFLAAFATWQVIVQSQSNALKLVAAIAGALAGVLPSVYAALKFPAHLTLCARLAGEFKNLQDRFRQAATVTSLTSFDEFHGEFQRLMGRLEKARRESYTAPEWVFKRAQTKVQSGDYEPDSR
jgi:hypothetical protein